MKLFNNWPYLISAWLEVALARGVVVFEVCHWLGDSFGGGRVGWVEVFGLWRVSRQVFVKDFRLSSNSSRLFFLDRTVERFCVASSNSNKDIT